MNPGRELGPASLVFRPYPGFVDGYIDPSQFREIFAADLDRSAAAAMAAGQRPADASVLAVPSGVPAWRSIPSWYMVASEDRTIPATTELFGAARESDDRRGALFTCRDDLAPNGDDAADRTGCRRVQLTASVYPRFPHRSRRVGELSRPIGTYQFTVDV